MSLSFAVRSLTAADEPFLWEMLYHAIYVPPAESPPPRAVIHHPDLAKYVKDWGRAGDMGCAAVETNQQQLIGAAWLRLLIGDMRGYGYVDDQTPELSMAVLPGFRGGGVGTALLECSIALARSRYTALSLSVDPINPAYRLYRRLGFQEVGRNRTSITMRRAL